MTRYIDADMCMAKMKDMPVTYDAETVQRCIEVVSNAPTVEMLTADEIQVIRIHMGAIKERLCNQKRWSEAVDYQIICDKLDKMLEMGEDDEIH